MERSEPLETAPEALDDVVLKESDSVAGYAKEIRKILRKDWDLVIGVTGTEGVGKSTLAIEIARAVDPGFTLEKNVLFNPSYEDLKCKLLGGLPRYSALIVDEAIKTMYKRNFMQSLQIKLNQIYGIIRGENKLTLLCMPYFSDFEPYFRKNRIRNWVHVQARGKAVIFSKDKNAFSPDDPWFLAENYKVVNSMGKGRTINQGANSMLKRYMRTKNFYKFLFFNPLEPEWFSAYEKLKANARSQLRDVDLSDVNPNTLQGCTVLNAVKAFHELGYSERQIADILCISRPVVNRRLKEDFVSGREPNFSGLAKPFRSVRASKT